MDNEHSESVRAFLRVFDERLEAGLPVTERRSAPRTVERAVRAAVMEVCARRVDGPAGHGAVAYWVSGTLNS